jgi:peptidyl-tRNA hydrolase, PTH1 family
VVIFGLGNPGKRYERTRHNFGFMVLDALAHEFDARFRTRFGYSEAVIALGGVRYPLVKPLRFMNCSGEVVKEYLAQFRDPEPDFLVVCDDLALPFGRIRIRTRGSDGGHNGLSDIIAHMGTGGFPRVRLGIGAVPAGMDGADYVLSEFTSDEREHLPDVVNAGKNASIMIIKRGLTAAMNYYNGRQLIPDRRPPTAGCPEFEAASGKRQAASGGPQADA